jgi:hypothetical protein
MTVRTSLVSALLLSAAFVTPAAAAGAPGTAPAGTTATMPSATPTPGTTTTAPGALPSTPQSTTPAPAPAPDTAARTGETPPTDVTASGTATPAQPTGTASTETETTTTTAATPAPATTSTTASSTDVTAPAPGATTTANVQGGGAGNIAPVQAQVGATVKGAGGVTLGTVASSDAQGNIQLATQGGNVALAPGLVKNVDGELQASAISRKDLMAMAATQRGDQQAAQQASTRRGLRYRAGPPRVETSAPAPAEQPAAPTTADQPVPATPSGDSGETQQPGTAEPGNTNSQ